MIPAPLPSVARPLLACILLPALVCAGGCKGPEAGSPGDANRAAAASSLAPGSGAMPTVVDGFWPADAPPEILVAPFMFGASDIQASQQGGGLGLFARRQERLAQKQLSQNEQIAERFVDALVQDLSAAGIPTRRVQPGMPLPGRGWLVRGAFIQLDDPETPGEVKIPLFGSGDTGRLGMWASVDDLAGGVPRPLFEVDTQGAGAGMGGGIPNPYTAAVKIVATQVEMSQSAETLARRTADVIVQRARQ